MKMYCLNIANDIVQQFIMLLGASLILNPFICFVPSLDAWESYRMPYYYIAVSLVRFSLYVVSELLQNIAK